MKIGRFELGFWDSKDPGIIWFEYINSSCKCKFLTICNVLFVWYDKDCFYKEKLDENN